MTIGNKGMARNPERSSIARKAVKRISWTLLAVLLFLTVGGRSVQAQEQSQPLPGKLYSRHAQFKLPLQMADEQRQTLREVQLYVKHGNDNWVCVDKAPPTQSHFPFKAAEDGEYWFSIVTVDQAGKASPADVSREAPALIVVVDTQAPQLEMTLLPSTAGGMVLRCEARDANLLPGSLKAEYQTNELTWLPLDSIPVKAGWANLFALPPEKSGTGLVRATVSDLAKNTVSKELDVKASMASSADSEAAPARTESKSEKPKEAVQTGYPILNSTHVSLDYQIDQVGPSGVGKVEIWITSDGGKTWSCHCEDKNKTSPAEFDLPGEGLFGVSIVVSNGNGMGDPPPANGDQPDYRIEIDTTKPEAQLLGARVLQADPSGALHITWKAGDKNLGTDCVSLFYARQKDGEWLPIAKGMKNDGAYRWAVPRDVGPEFYVRMEVTDKAGNSTRCELPDKIVLDSSRPKAKVLGIAAGAPHPATPPTGN